MGKDGHDVAVVRHGEAGVSVFGQKKPHIAVFLFGAERHACPVFCLFFGYGEDAAIEGGIGRIAALKLQKVQDGRTLLRQGTPLMLSRPPDAGNGDFKGI